ncbi:cytochrome P450 [Amycolatopsis deserti]|uniref:Cytochrome P450 n=1 Tax=Amycolatopsis deserti TaxID=185696 RepID=A0ABQ3IF10_9PSEU|nr:cytochrome P450 [Amycolatopsis deserti]GHE80619.1 cytochrome P450 [Amycolatopsis deserti]
MTSTPPSLTQPEVESFNILSPGYLADPLAYLGAVRERAPIVHLPELGVWVPTRYRDIDRILHDHETFSSAVLQIPPLTPALRELVPTEDEEIVRTLFANQLVFTDPPAHDVQRRSAQRTFTKRQVDRTTGRIEEICDELIDSFAGLGEADLMDRFARRFSLRVVGTMIGLDVDDLERFHGMVTDFSMLLGPSSADAGFLGFTDEQVAARFAGVVEGYRYFAGLVEERRAEPRQDLVTAMLTLADDEGRPVMTTEEILAHLVGIVAAGTDTTSNLVCSLVLRLTREPAVRDAAIADPGLWPAVVEEGLRRESPGDKAVRVVTRDTELAGRTLRAGDKIMVLFAAANGDPDRFADPLAFDIERPGISGSRHFGTGRHFCLGAPLVRPEARIAMEKLYSRLPGLEARLDVAPDFAPTLMRLRNTLPVRWTVRG